MFPFPTFTCKPDAHLLPRPQGDSGGPVVYLDEAKRYVLAGVVSRGYGCGLQEFPGLYVDVRLSTYLSWIKKLAFA